MGPASLIAPAPVARPSARRRGRLLLAVLVVHGVLLWLVSAALHPPLPRTASRAFLPVSVRIVAKALAATVRAAKEQPMSVTPPPAVALRLRRPEPTFSAPTTTAPTPAPAAEAIPATGPVTTTAPDADRQALPVTTPPALDLNLPPLRRGLEPASPARLAVEAQTGRRFASTPEVRLARRLQTDWTVENLGDGRVRMRRGDACVMLSETQASQLDPWNNRGTTPRNGGPCGGD